MSGTFRITDFFDPHAVSVSEFFGRGENKKLFIPDHQRNYLN
ncbi:hypothetical protein HFA01_06830 [Halobacillus faecis]|uniref:Uncharacterized protein n=1 Tax=Halobacillus faecis TaxID=360184 RepID=A0A511WPI8_9BACI|nr:hypothetical protein HFA01_06830 [Halobacillus faecis]